MALIKCKECGKDISDTVKKCPNCGFKNKTEDRNKILKHKKLLILISIIIIMIIGISGFGYYKYTKEQERIRLEQEMKLTTSEEKAVEAVKLLKSKLKNQESLIVYEIRCKNIKNGSIDIYIDYSAQNGFGGSNRNIATISGNKIYTDSEADTKITKDMMPSKVAEILMAQTIQEVWQKPENFEILDKDKIMKHIN